MVPELGDHPDELRHRQEGQGDALVPDPLGILLPALLGRPDRPDLLLRGLDSIAEKAGILGRVLLWILRTLLASAWAITTMFVIPSMVYRGVGPFDAIRDSAVTLRRAWGESLIRSVGLGLAAFACILPCILLVVAGIATAPYGLALAAAGVLGLLACAIFFGVLSTVFNTVLYHWATAGVVPEGFDAETLSGALRVRQRSFFGRA
jgi:Family of unknown function (DUF6159)